MVRVVVLLSFIVSVLLADGHREYSQNPPGGLKTKNVPQFVVIGADDCGTSEGNNWIVDFLATKTNPKGKGNAATYDGAPVTASFYVNGRYASDSAVVASWKKMVDAGHEIGNHTVSHFIDSNYAPIDARKFGDSIWLDEIAQNDLIIMQSLGIPLKSITGFRTPRLEYNSSTFRMIALRGFEYDCSIEEGGEPGHNGTNNYWPYQMDNGSVADSLMTGWSTGDADWGYKPAGKVKGLWQIPVYNYIVPSDKYAKKYGFEKGLRGRIHGHMSFFDTTTGNLTGFDYNVFAPGNWAGAQMKNNEYLAVLKYSFDQHIKGNRTPFTMGMHPDFYVASQDEYYGSAGDYKARRKVVEEFIDYVLSHDDVRIVTAQQMLEWVKNPVSLD